MEHWYNTYLHIFYPKVMIKVKLLSFVLMGKCQSRMRHSESTRFVFWFYFRTLKKELACALSLHGSSFLPRTEIVNGCCNAEWEFCKNASLSDQGVEEDDTPVLSWLPPPLVLIPSNLFYSESLDASGVVALLTQLSFGYIMRFQIGNGSL